MNAIIQPTMTQIITAADNGPDLSLSNVKRQEQQFRFLRFVDRMRFIATELSIRAEVELTVPKSARTISIPIQKY